MLGEAGLGSGSDVQVQVRGSGSGSGSMMMMHAAYRKIEPAMTVALTKLTCTQQTRHIYCCVCIILGRDAAQPLTTMLNTMATWRAQAYQKGKREGETAGEEDGSEVSPSPRAPSPRVPSLRAPKPTDMLLPLQNLLMLLLLPMPQFRRSHVERNHFNPRLFQSEVKQDP